MSFGIDNLLRIGSSISRETYKKQNNDLMGYGSINKLLDNRTVYKSESDKNKALRNKYMECERKIKNRSIMKNMGVNNKFSPKNQSIDKLKENIEERNLEEISFKNNVLDVKNHGKYKVKTLMHGYTKINITNKENVLNVDKKDSCRYEDVLKTNRLIKGLTSGKSGTEIVNDIRSNFKDFKEAGIRLQNMGCQCGKYFQVRGCEDKLFLDTDGMIYTNDELDKIKKAYTNKNLFKRGYNDKSEFIIDNVKYKLDKNGYLNIPDEVICTPSKITIKK